MKQVDLEFRGYSKEHRRWFFGTPVLEIYRDDVGLIGFRHFIVPPVTEGKELERVYVEEDSIVQDTGLVDSDLVRIFEDDLVEFVTPDTNKKIICRVCWHYRGMWSLKCGADWYKDKDKHDVIASAVLRGNSSRVVDNWFQYEKLTHSKEI